MKGITISGGATTKIFDVTDGQLGLTDLTLTAQNFLDHVCSRRFAPAIAHKP